MHIAVLSGFILSLAAPWGHLWTRRSSGWVFALLPTALFAYFASYLAPVATGGVFAVAYPWVPSLGVELAFRLDGLALLFALLITGIGALVFIYAGGYLGDHPLLGRFYAYLSLFMASMLGVVLADNLLLLFVFWELTSISSYLLIGFEHEREEARAAALQALLVTGGGGLALLAGLVLVGQMTGTSSIAAINAAGGLAADARYLPALLLVLLGAFTKSAQAPFHFWLPGAMEAPTPVSAYLHSATMVKAGIYLLARLSPALGGTDAWFYTVTGVGLVTMLVGAVLALNHGNLKRILAYTTISSLGAMVMLLGVGTEEAVLAALVFLLAHALYKGALFMLAGAVYHETGTQEIDELGGLRRKMPILFALMALAAFSLASFGPTLSFIGKELMLEAALHAPHYAGLLVAALLVFAAISVAAALILAIRPFFGALKPTPHSPHDPPLSLWLGPALLAALGPLLVLVPAGVNKLIAAPASAAVLGEAHPVKLALWHGLNLPLALSAAGVLLGGLLYFTWDGWRRTARRIPPLLAWGPTRVYEASLSGLARLATELTHILQSGHLHRYMAIVIGSTVGLVGITLLRVFTTARAGERFQAQPWFELRFYEALLAALILVAAFVVVRSDSRLVATAALGVVGFGVSLIFILFGAPDLAMTQILVESVTVILLVLILYHLPGFSHLTSRAGRARDAALALVAGGLMTALVLIAGGAAHFPPISSYYLENSVELAHGRNIVNVILVDFRGLDTLGEITVLSLAAIGVFALLRARRKPGKGTD